MRSYIYSEDTMKEFFAQKSCDNCMNSFMTPPDWEEEPTLHCRKKEWEIKDSHNYAKDCFEYQSTNLLEILTELVKQLEGIGIPDWHGAEGLDLSDAKKLIALHNDYQEIN